MTKNYLKETDKVHQLFKAFHAHDLPKKRELCDTLKHIIDEGEIRGSHQIGDLLSKLISEEIGCKELKEAICKVLNMKEENLDNFRKDPDYEPTSSDDDSDTDDDELDDEMEDDIQLAQRVPEMNENQNDEHAYHHNDLSNKDKKEIVHLCKTMRDQLKKMEDACLHGCANRACNEINRMKTYFENYVEVIQFLVHN